MCLKVKDLTDCLKDKMMKRIEICKKEKSRQDEKHKAMCERMFKSASSNSSMCKFSTFFVNFFLIF